MLLALMVHYYVINCLHRDVLALICFIFVCSALSSSIQVLMATLSCNSDSEVSGDTFLSLLTEG